MTATGGRLAAMMALLVSTVPLMLITVIDEPGSKLAPSELRPAAKSEPVAGANRKPVHGEFKNHAAIGV